jgi:hypothetical protein
MRVRALVDALRPTFMDLRLLVDLRGPSQTLVAPRMPPYLLGTCKIFRVARVRKGVRRYTRILGVCEVCDEGPPRFVKVCEYQRASVRGSAERVCERVRESPSGYARSARSARVCLDASSHPNLHKLFSY